ncbi:hypothetical protein CASFOL_015563 [Castilleja foliolosa]|uniref:Pectinesterase inhibitor domain-containing protein n=1 Tax=Castilleja foliolosa TaxID=1961234 RepID=A0ABD3DE29_9LAMI
MKSMNDNTLKTTLVQQDPNFSTFRRRNKILILISLFLILTLTVILGALITHVVHTNPRFHDPPVNPAVKALCDAAADTPSCLKAFNPIISVKSRPADPSQILTLSLQTAAKKLENVINVTTGTNNLKNCSSSLRVGLGMIRERLRVDPFVEMKSEERRAEMMNKSIVVKILKSCLDDLRRVEPTAVISEVKAKVQQVMVYVNSSGGFLDPLVLRRIYYDSYVVHTGMIGPEMCVLFGLQLLFMFFLFFSLFRIR